MEMLLFCFLPSHLPLSSSQTSAHHLDCARGGVVLLLSQRPLWFVSFHSSWWSGKRLQWGNITHSRVSAALLSCGPAELLELLVPEDFTSKRLKKPNYFGNRVTEVSPYMLRCCLFLTSLRCCVLWASKRGKSGVGAASSAGRNGLGLQWTCSFCFM